MTDAFFHNLCVNCELCRAKGYTEQGGSPCRLHGGGESFEVGKDEEGLLFFYCPNCTQRMGEDAKHRWHAEAELERVRKLLADIDAGLGNGADQDAWPPGLTRREAIENLRQEAAAAQVVIRAVRAECRKFNFPDEDRPELSEALAQYHEDVKRRRDG